MRKAVIPAAGLGTRFLPATKAMPKEMLPVVDKPAIQYVVEEAVRAGLTDVVMITGRNKRALEDHFDREPFLEQILESKGDLAKLAAVQESSSLVDLHYLRQGDPKGLGHAVLRARAHVGNEPFAVLLGDDLIDEQDSILDDMARVQELTGGSVVALMEVEPEQISVYGCADVVSSEVDGSLRIRGLVEKPEPIHAPSNLAIIGRYVLHPRIFDVLDQTPPGRGGEIQLTDALQTLAVSEGEGSGVYGVIFRGRRFDTGDKLSYLKAVMTVALERGDTGPALREWLEEVRTPARQSADA
ncbi:UTP--glucose-1-phosphate uridylyltransferase [Arthrobacter stackebrandtii]|uniref:UTP--glucose-1-phosphate uridylyltransferase n=1 Tax=Arthrobacter stackebrandtii TaxID=272161 RepID=A0ABS4YUJ1_9MICC|nr:UTP--glucose-1-phosphate uridylyltransferase GalU [Arthrobacter stackebrandtii]MBP2412456.1 UTP--glucose-1-phosphate uridylyltransferase [Arthrobacter stackebrandtii]PYH02216.1 UTP--glucose-1-phosphate uridylyltransferase [Arthrobacter stackebrandtii]